MQELVPRRPFSLKVSKATWTTAESVVRTVSKATGVTATLGSGGSDSNVKESPEHLLHESLPLTRSPRRKPQARGPPFPLFPRCTHRRTKGGLPLWCWVALLCPLTGPDTVPGSYRACGFLQVGLHTDVAA